MRGGLRIPDRGLRIADAARLAAAGTAACDGAGPTCRRPLNGRWGTALHTHATAILIVFLLSACATVGAAEPAKPAKPDDKPAAAKPATEPRPQEELEWLGSSVAPKGGGKARTSLFGIVGEGYKFVYVFDRSGSMGGRGRESLQAVKAELIKSLKDLDTVHQFQIIFYNEKPIVFNPAGAPGRLAFATDENKRRAERFLGTITADGGTDHEAALRQAIGLQPDVIFFLTDADDPKLSAKQLAKIRDLAAGIIIHAVEFGPGPKPAGKSFLAELAHQNGGQHVYVDIAKRAAENPPKEKK
jgi:hypothetical protein